MQIGDRMREFRKATGINLTDMATKIGISQSYLSQIELGQKPCPHDVLQKFCAECRIGLADFFSESNVGISPEMLRIVKILQRMKPSQQNIVRTLIEEMSKEKLDDDE